MNTRAAGEGVTQVLIMCDGEGNLGDPDAAKRQTAVENHYKWVDGREVLGCHTIRVNGYSAGTPEEQMKLVADGMRKLCEYADTPRHQRRHRKPRRAVQQRQVAGARRSSWSATSAPARCPTSATSGSRGPAAGQPGREGRELRLVCRRRGDDAARQGRQRQAARLGRQRQQSDIDLPRMMKIVVDAGWRGHCGIEHGPEGKELESVVELRKQLEARRDQLSKS